MKLKVGKTYITRGGYEVRIDLKEGGFYSGYYVDNKANWHGFIDGLYYSVSWGYSDRKDLVKRKNKKKKKKVCFWVVETYQRCNDKVVETCIVNSDSMRDIPDNKFFYHKYYKIKTRDYNSPLEKPSKSS